jgi:hypothetical protein
VTLEVAGQGVVGVAFETTQNTYLAPTDFIPLRSETLELMEDKYYRLNIRGTADRTGALQGYKHVEGDVEFEVTADQLLRWLYAARVLPAKSGAGPYTYTFTPVGVAKTSTGVGAAVRKTLSISCERSGVVFGYVGCSVTQMVFTVDSGVLIGTFSVFGSDEASQADLVPTWPTTTPYAPGKVVLEFPDATPRPDVDTFNITINDNGSAANRLNGTRGAAYITWGEREVTATYDMDFDNVTDYNVYKNQTIQALEILASNNATTDEVSIKLNNCVVDTYPVSLSGFGDILRASINMHSIALVTDAYTIVVKSAISIT